MIWFLIDKDKYLLQEIFFIYQESYACLLFTDFKYWNLLINYFILSYSIFVILHSGLPIFNAHWWYFLLSLSSFLMNFKSILFIVSVFIDSCFYLNFTNSYLLIFFSWVFFSSNPILVHFSIIFVFLRIFSFFILLFLTSIIPLFG